MKKTISGIRGIVGDDLSVADVMEFCQVLLDDVTMTPAPHLLASHAWQIHSFQHGSACSFSIAPLGLVSRAITHFELPSMQKLLQNSITSATERSSPTMPRIPEMVFFIRFYPQRFFINSNRLLLRLGSSVR